MDLTNTELELSIISGDLTWYNFASYAEECGDNTRWHSHTLKKEFKATINTSRSIGKIYIKFSNEAYKTWFILRWS